MKETKPEITLTPEQTIEKLLDNFNFDKVQKVMIALDIKYFDSKETPTLEQLRETASNSLKLACVKQIKTGKKKVRCAVGGFNSEVRKYKDGEILFSLDFRVADFNWSNRDTCY